MSDLEWSVTSDGHESAGYRIRRIDGRPPRWQLETIDGPVHAGARAPTVSVHPSLRAAKRRAGRDETERIRLARVRGHIVFGVVCGLAFLVFLVSGSFAAFVVAMVFLYVALRFLAGAIEVGLGEAWNWDHESEGRSRLSWSARIVVAATQYLRRRRLAGGRPSESPAIIILPPEHERPEDSTTAVPQ